MPNPRLGVSGSEASNDQLVAIIVHALEYPKRGTHRGFGLHVNMPETWNGVGTHPPGWTVHEETNWVVATNDSFVPIDNSLAALLQGPVAQSRLTGQQQGQLTAALAGRSTVDLEAGGHRPKPSAALAAQERSATR